MKDPLTRKVSFRFDFLDSLSVLVRLPVFRDKTWIFRRLSLEIKRKLEDITP